MTSESVQNQVSTPADGVQAAPAVAVQTATGSQGAGSVVLGGGGTAVSTVTQGAATVGWLESKVQTFETAFHAKTAQLGAEVNSVVAKVEGDAVADLKALVQHLHGKYDAVVTRVAALEAHIEGRFGRI